jgi:hypothetical protein
VNVTMPHLNELISNANHLFTPNVLTDVLLSWPKPNYINPEDRGWTSSIVLLVFLSITFIVFVARIWARLAVGKNSGLDDILMSLAMFPLIGLTISAILGMLFSMH